jgi:hypothetical protein
MPTQVNVNDIITDALIELQVLAPGEAQGIDNDLFNFALRKLNRMMDRWAAREIMAYNVAFNTTFTTIPGHAPHTIGPTGDFVVAQRPVMIPSLSYNLQSGGQSIWLPLAPIDDDDWAMQTIPDLQSTVPTLYYYSPDFPNGSIYLWPVPQAAHLLRIELWGLLPINNAAGGTMALPPGYWDAVVNNLALQLAPFAGPSAIVTPDLRKNALDGLRAIQGNNFKAPKITTQDAGMPKKSGGASRPDFNFLTGKPW